MSALSGAVRDIYQSLCATHVGAGRGVAIALTVALIVVAAGQLRLGAMRHDRPL